ncbi:endo-1,4-beta-glucanase [Streptomyces sp. NPDC101213]|uniref:GH12 family glycosyl hydrolase domain-containing protein n=1 Tax=Streptomyces sp. NPDC101213 TaxID=3366130 RepID=UPI00382685DF
MNDNLWNQEKAVGGQCVRDNSRTGSAISRGTSYDWADSATGKDHDVKSYAGTVLGRHGGWRAGKASTGLPIRVGDRRKVTVSWDFSVSANPGVMNVAHDLWPHDKNTADRQDQPTDEVMIRLDRQGGAGPLGTRYGSVSLGGAMRDLYRGDIGWNVHSFVRRTDTTGATLNPDDFTRTLVRRKLLGDDKYVSGIESGTEVFKGKGRLDTKAYAVTIG